ncbi:flagellar biosynthesis repressor FlbT [Rhodovastum atsumiense]|uniref:flagellar biosynthesis repressor FlbT n=1 Tax=Rhodovastum atsumiense TaxID=504468 RepID=UPI002024FAF1|nr:flagellar biosynthesis repressor FlbT [Rhodovastum atsumiense]
MPLKLKLGANEQLVVNGAVMVNGGYRTTLMVRNFAHILREKDVLQEDQADTPTKRLYFHVQAMLLKPPPSPELVAAYQEQLAALRRAFVRPDNLVALDEVDRVVTAGDYYKALVQLQTLIGVEASLLNLDPPPWRRARLGQG